MYSNPLNLVKDNSLIDSLAADPIKENYRRQVDYAYSLVKPEIFPEAELVHISTPLAEEMGLSEEFVHSEKFEKIITGQELYPDTAPYSLNYAGHQFGNWAGQLGDGRAINLFESIYHDKRFTWQLKGAGETPYSRSADGKAVLRSSIREHICSEAMHFLGVPTTRSLSLSLTGQEVLRDIMYDGNAAYEKGAVVCRVAPTFIRFGNFQIFAAKRDKKQLTDLLNFTISNFFPDIAIDQNGYNQFFQEVVNRTLHLMIEWMRVGFVHGVMNTDNMSILGLTIDYGPYGWLDNYDPDWTPNTTDAGQRRYRYGNQANIGLWNLYQLANALTLIIEDTDALENSLKLYQDKFDDLYQNMMLSKLGLPADISDASIVEELQKVMLLSETDYTIFFRELANVQTEMTPAAALSVVQKAFYKSDEIISDVMEAWLSWLNRYLVLLSDISMDNGERRIRMNKVNPKYIFRNYIAQEIIEEAEKGNYEKLNEVFDMIQNPYAEATKYNKYYELRPDYARNKIGCSQLSCSS